MTSDASIVRHLLQKKRCLRDTECSEKQRGNNGQRGILFAELDPADRRGTLIGMRSEWS